MTDDAGVAVSTSVIVRISEESVRAGSLIAIAALVSITVALLGVAAVGVRR